MKSSTLSRKKLRRKKFLEKCRKRQKLIRALYPADWNIQILDLQMIDWLLKED